MKWTILLIIIMLATNRGTVNFVKNSKKQYITDRKFRLRVTAIDMVTKIVIFISIIVLVFQIF